MTWSVAIYVYTGKGGWAKKECNAMLLKETLKEMNRLKSHRGAREQYICTPQMTRSPESPVMAMWPLIHA